MTNKPMLSVEREFLERLLRVGLNAVGIGCKTPAEELRAILDKPVFESQYAGMNQQQAQAVSDGVDEILHDKPAAQHQGEPVAKAKPVAMLHAERLTGRDGEYGVTVEDSEWLNTCRLTGGIFNLYVEQPAPVAVDAEILERFPEINFANYGQEEVEALQAWAFEAYEAIARLNGVKP